MLAVVCCAPGKTDLAQAFLLENGIVTEVPRRKITRRLPRSKRYMPAFRLLMPGWLFCDADPWRERGKDLSARFPSWRVRDFNFLGRRVEIDQSQIDHLLLVDETRKTLGLLEIGTVASITSGPCEGLHVTVVGHPRPGFYRVLAVGASHPLEIPSLILSREDL